MRDVYLADTPTDAATLLDKTIVGGTRDDVEEIVSLGNTLASWRTEILAYHDTGASNGPTEGLNLCVKKSNAAATDSDPSTTTGSASSFTPAASPGRHGHPHHASERIRTRAPHSNA